MKYEVGQVVMIKGYDNYAFHEKLVKITLITGRVIHHNGKELYGVRGEMYESAFSEDSVVYKESEIVQC